MRRAQERQRHLRTAVVVAVPFLLLLVVSQSCGEPGTQGSAGAREELQRGSDGLVAEVVVFAGRKLTVRGRRVDGQKHGEWTCSRQDGRIVSIGLWVNGVAHGTQRHYHRNGQLACSGEMKKGKLTGLWSYWYDSGQMLFRGTYLMGRREGWWEYWNRDGSVDSGLSGMYRRDEKVSK